MIYTLCMEENDLVVDIKVNREQKIIDTFLVLQDGNVLPSDIDFEKVQIFSGRKGEYIDGYASYAHEDIFQGDILYIK